MHDMIGVPRWIYVYMNIYIFMNVYGNACFFLFFQRSIYIYFMVESSTIDSTPHIIHSIYIYDVDQHKMYILYIIIYIIIYIDIFYVR